MSALPAIPAGLPRAPEPTRDAGEFARADYLAGPIIYSDFYSGTASVSFPTFGRQAEQSQLLRQAGYEFIARAGAWGKRIDQLDAGIELAWARRLYAALHPGWRWASHPVDSDNGEQA